jgi:hypothetical protein
MKKTLTLLTAILGLASVIQAQVPTATYRWNFNQTNANSTNYLFPTSVNGLVPDPAFQKDGVLREVDGSGTSVNLMGVPGSGVSSGTFSNIPFDRALLVPGNYGANSYMARTAGDAYALTNWPNGGIITKFTITGWAKSEGVQGAFPRIVMFGANGQDAGSAGLNAFGLLFYNNGDLQLKIHNAGNPADSANGMHTAGLPLAGAATNWVFIAVTCDMTLPTGGAVNTGTNTVFYFGDRVNSLLNNTLAPGNVIIRTNYIATTANSGLNGTAADGPGYIDFSPTGPVPLPYVSIANRYQSTSSSAGGGNRAFNGRYDDIRIFANQVLTLAQIEAVRTNAPPGLNGPLVVTLQPTNTTVAEGQGAAFTAVATEAANRTYQWYKIPKGVGTVSNAIAGATSATLYTTNLTVAGNNGDKYMCIVHSTDPLSDNGGAGGKTVYGTVTVLSTNSYTVTPGLLKFEYFAASSGSSVGTFLGAPTANYTNNTPDQTLFLSAFDTRTAFPDNSHFNYFARITGWITPTVTTNYVFLLRGADQAQLSISTDGGVTTNVIAQDFRSGPQVFYGAETAGAVSGNDYSAPIALVAGTSYPVVAYLKASSGQNFLQVAWRQDSGLVGGDMPTSDQSLADRLQPISASALSTLALPLATVSITAQPTASPSSTTTANKKITLNLGVSATGSGPVVVQWRKNGVNIPGATGSSYTTPYLTAADNGASYSAVVSAPGVSTTSSAVTVTVNTDNVKPSITSASSDDDMSTVMVQFSEPVSAATALNAANYQINGGALAVTSVAWAADTNLVDAPTYDAVKLKTALQADNTAYTLSVSGVNDTAANTIIGGSTAQFTSYGFASGFAKLEYFEDQTYNSTLVPADDLTVNGFVSTSPKFLNNDPDTIVYPKNLVLSPEGFTLFRNGAGGLLQFPTAFFGTRLSTIITPTNTGNYVFYLAADDSAILWLSTDANPANKRVIAVTTTAAGFPTQWSSSHSDSYDTNTLISLAPVPGAKPWPVADGSGFAIITLTAGQHYYLEVDQRETAGFSSFARVNWDGGTGVAPADGTQTVLTSEFLGWHFPQPAITSFAKVANNFTVNWTNSFGRISQGAVPWPGIIAPDTAPSIVPSFPTGTLQSTLSLNPATWTTVTTNGTLSVPATNPAQFFRAGNQ